VVPDRLAIVPSRLPAGATATSWGWHAANKVSRDQWSHIREIAISATSSSCTSSEPGG
jgi:hypothetical protein